MARKTGGGEDELATCLFCHLGREIEIVLVGEGGWRAVVGKAAAGWGEESGRREMDGWRNGISVWFPSLGNMRGNAEGRMEGAGH